MGDNNQENKLEVNIFNRETGELVTSFDTDADSVEITSETVNVVDDFDDVVRSLGESCTINFEEAKVSEEFIACMLEKMITGSTIESDDGKMYLKYLNENNVDVARTPLMSDVINVEQPNDSTVFVEFADGTKEVAHCNEGDTFSLETGVLICLVKKLFDEMGIFCSGSSAYNKVVEYALTKLDCTKRAKKLLIEQKRANRKLENEVKQRRRQHEYKAREARINEMKEAYKRAFDEVSKTTAKELENGFKDLIEMFEDAEKENDK